VAWKPDSERGDRHARGYGRGWERLRGKALHRDRWLCQLCIKQGKQVNATQVDHITPKSHGGKDELSNLQCLCVPCHEMKTSRDRTGRPAGGCDAQGLPLDPSHPWAQRPTVKAPRRTRRGRGV